MNPKFLYQQAIEVLNTLYSDQVIYRPIVPLQQQEEVLDKLKQSINFEQFFFVLDLVNKEVKQVHGFGDWLGWADSTFSFYQYFQILHPHFYDSIMKVAESSFETANSKKFDIKFMQNCIVALIALRHSDGKYLLVKRSLYPFQIDESGKVTAYLNHYVLLGEYLELGIRIGNGSQIFAFNEQSYFKQKQQKSIEKNKKIFKLNDTELKILRIVSENPELTLRNISEQFGFNLSSLESTHNNRILKKMREHFNTEIFKTLKDAASFLKLRGII